MPLSPWWHLGEAVGELPRLLLGSIFLPTRRQGQAAATRPGTVPGATTEGPAGRVVLVGGTGLCDDLVVHMIHLAGGREASIAVLPSASLDFARAGERYARSFRRFGASRVEVLDPVTRERAADADLVRSLRAADLIFLGGGREALFLDILRGSPAHEAIRDAYRAGAVVAGIGAGAAVLGSLVCVPRRRNELLWEEGLGLLPVALLDRERLQKGQAGSVFYAVAGSPAGVGAGPVTGVGLDDGTALVVEGGRHATVVGRGMAMVALPRQRQEDAGSPGLIVHVLPTGYAYDFAEGRPLPPLEGPALRQAR